MAAELGLLLEPGALLATARTVRPGDAVSFINRAMRERQRGGVPSLCSSADSPGLMMQAHVGACSQSQLPQAVHRDSASPSGPLAGAPSDTMKVVALVRWGLQSHVGALGAALGGAMCADAMQCHAFGLRAVGRLGSLPPAASRPPPPAAAACRPFPPEPSPYASRLVTQSQRRQGLVLQHGAVRAVRARGASFGSIAALRLAPAVLAESLSLASIGLHFIDQHFPLPHTQIVALGNLLPVAAETDDLDSYMYQTASVS